MPLLRLHAQAGVIFFMFLVGLELDGRMIRRSSRATIFISTASIVLPFVLGYALAYALYPRLAPPGVQFTPFALFIGVSMSITAFPVLARILRDRGLNRTRMGNMAMACAAVDDVTAWCLLALVISISEFGDWGSAITHMPGVDRRAPPITTRFSRRFSLAPSCRRRRGTAARSTTGWRESCRCCSCRCSLRSAASGPRSG